MTPDEKEWQINLVKDRYHRLDLTFEQAEKIYQFEQERDIHSEKHYFSSWEEFDYELSTFRQILTTEQLKIYEKETADKTKQHEQNLMDEDIETTKEIAYVQELLAYYENEFLPDLYNDTIISIYPKLQVSTKIDFLKSEYKQYLNDTKKAILTSHFRHYRLFKPKTIQAALLRHRLSYLLPDYRSFKFSADDPTKAVINYVNARIKKFPDQTEELLRKKFSGLSAFNEGMSKKYYGEPKGYRIIIGPPSEEEEREGRVMSLLLLDRQGYDSQQ